MKKKVFFIIIFLLVKSYSLSLYSQTTLKNDELAAYKNIPQEKIFIHHNTSFLLAGEYLYYKVYCINSNTNKLSSISKIAYVELLGIDKTSIFNHKIKLETGLGQGDFIIPATIPSGSYKLIAYTENMKNIENNFFQSDICIINPFQLNQSSILAKNQSVSVQNFNTKKEYLKNNDPLIDSIDNNYIDFTINANSFKNREKVVLTFKSLKNNLSNGNYSISVRKIDTIKIPERLTTKSYKSLYPQKKSSNSITNSSIYLPELRGELLSGKIFYKDSELPSSNTKIALSIQGNQSIFKIATTNELGVFYFNIHEEYENPSAIIQVLDDEKNNLSMILNEHSSVDLNRLNFYDFKITPNIKDYILKRSVYSQVENVYSSIKPNTVKVIDSVSPFYNSIAKGYFLDDYTRFPTIKETVIEIINEVYISKNTFHVKLYNQLFESDSLPLVLMDGVLIQNHKELIDYNANNIKKISVISDIYICNSQPFDGLISIETIDGNYQADLSESYIKKVPLFKPLEVKNYFNQIYDGSEKLNRIPDYRIQLLWEPNFNLNENENEISFFTSDNKGDYEICFEGFTKDGIPITLRKVITIE